jgi:thioredoxin-related protein
MSTKCCAATAAGVLWCLCAIVPALGGEDVHWQTDFEAAKNQAKAENKLLLVDFTGSDWCSWCKKLHEEVFDKDAFKDEAPKHFVLVELDFPHEKKLPNDLKAQNDKLAKRYKIHGYPTVLLVDADGQVVAHTGYQAGGPENYVKQLAGFLDAYASIVKMKAELDKVEGLDRARLLDKLVDAYLNLHNEIDELGEWSKEIVRLDLGNKTGLRPKHEFRAWMAIYEKRMEDHKLAEATRALDKALAVQGISADLRKTAESRLEKLKPLVEAMEAVAKSKGELEGTEGLDRAKLLDTYLEAQAKLLTLAPNETAMQDFLKEGPKLAKEIVKLEKDNKDGLKTKYTFKLKIMDVVTQAQAGAFAKARATLEQAAKLPGLTDEQKTTIEQIRTQLPAANVKGKGGKTRG